MVVWREKSRVARIGVGRGEVHGVNMGYGDEAGLFKPDALSS